MHCDSLLRQVGSKSPARGGSQVRAAGLRGGIYTQKRVTCNGIEADNVGLLKYLRTNRGLTTKEVCRMTGASENIYNDLGKDTGVTRAITESLRWRCSITYRRIICSDSLLEP